MIYHRFMNRAAMAHQILPRRDKLLERRLDVVEIDIGKKAVDTGIDAGRLWSMHVALRRNQISQHAKVGEPAGVSLVRRRSARCQQNSSAES